jgi:hypothetical protein
MEGRKWRAEFADFNVGADSIGLHQADPNGLRRIEQSQIKSIKLTRPVTYVCDTTALGAVGVPDAHADNRKPFVVVFKDDTRITGNTLGFVRSIGLAQSSSSSRRAWVSVYWRPGRWETAPIRESSFSVNWVLLECGGDGWLRHSVP